LQPTVENVEKSFYGDSGLSGGIGQILKQLSDMHCFSIISERIELFRSSSGGAELEKKRNEIHGKFHQLILQDRTTNEVKGRIKPFNFGDRFEVRVSGVDAINAGNIPNKNSFAQDDGNQVLVQFILARDNEEQLRIPEKIHSLLKQLHDYRIVFVTMPHLTFCDTRADHWEEYISQCAQLALAGEKTTQNVHKQIIKSWDDEWITKILAQSQQIKGYKPTNGEPETIDLSWGTLKEWLWNFVKVKLPCCVDEYADDNISAFGPPTALARWALAGIQFETATGPQGNFVKIFVNEGILGDESWFEQNPQHNLSKIRELCYGKLKNTIGANTRCSIRKIYIELRRTPYGLRCVPYSAFVLGFVLKGWLTQKQPLQWTDERITRQLDAEALAEIIESVVKDDGANKIKDEKLICRLSKEERAFVEQSGIMFGISVISSDYTVETALDAAQKKIEQTSNRVPLWVLPEYITLHGDPQAGLIGSIIQNFCAASGISSKGKTEERANHIKEIGKLLLETDGLAKAFSVYVKSEIFEDAFQIWIDKNEPRISGLAENIGDLAKRYCQNLKAKLAETAGWLWNAQDIEQEIGKLLREYQIILELKPLLGCVSYISFKDAIQGFRDAIYKENKIPLSMIVQRYHALLSLFDSLGQPDEIILSSDLYNILTSERETINAIFFDPLKSFQLSILNEKLSDCLPSGMDEILEIYQMLPTGANFDEQAFIQQVRIKAEEHFASSIAAQIRNVWEEKTGTKTPNDWSTKHRIPAAMIFSEDRGVSDILSATANPTNFTSAKLKTYWKYCK